MKTFHGVISWNFDDLENVATFQDDILLYADSQKQMAETLKIVLVRAESAAINFN